MATDKTFFPFATGQNFDSGIYDYESDTSFTSVDDSLSPAKNSKLLDLNTTSQPSVKIDQTASRNSSSYATDPDSVSPITNLLPSIYIGVPITVQVALLQVQFLSACSRNGRTKLDELQTFYDLQSAQIESERFQLLSQNRSDARLCESVNCYHDSEHRELIKMVEKSLGLLQGKRTGDDAKTSTSTTRVPPDGSATQHMADWFDDNRNHPYPSPAVKYRMAEQGNISIAQVNKWFSNRRVRSGAADGNASKRRRC